MAHSSAASKPRPAGIQRTVIYSLLLREVQTRFGKYRLGYFWAFLEPALHVTVFFIVFMYIKQRQVAGMSTPMLLVTGILPFFLFRYIMTSGLAAISSNLQIFNYRRVKPADAVIARILLEVLTFGTVFVTFLMVLKYFGYDIPIHNPVGVFATFALLILFGSGIAFALSIVGVLYPEAAKLIPMFIRPLYFISGVFYTATFFPPDIRKYVLWNPLLHVTELLRGSMLSTFPSHGSWLYLSICAVISFFLGLSYHRMNRVKILTSVNRP
jgi:capsular polysaccharide transport system permease protein